MALHATRAVQPLPPDAAHAAVVARNIVTGLGYTIDWIPYHFGLRDGVRQVPEWHGILRAPVLATLFAAFGIRDEPVRIPGLTFSAATGLVAFAFARTLFGTTAGWLACLITLSSAPLLFWGWVGTDDTGFAFFFLTTIYLCHLGLTSTPRYLKWAGLVGGLALLEKQTGFFLSGVFLVVLWLGRSRGIRTASTAVWLYGPFLLALGAYLLRNYAAHGDISFRLGPLNWLYKAHGMAALYRLYEPPPTLGEVIASLGPARALEIVQEQVGKFLEAVFMPPRNGVPYWPRPEVGGLNLLAPGIPSVAFHLRRNPTFFWLAVASIAGSIVFVCGLYSVEKRYFLMLIPLAAVSLAGVIAYGLESRASGALGFAKRGGAMAAALSVVVYAAAFGARMSRLPSPARDHREGCRAAVAWIRENVPPEDVILTPDPWWTSWVTERLTVMSPAGGLKVLRRVGRHYDADWALYPPLGKAARLKIWKDLHRAPRQLMTARAFSQDGCIVYSLRWPREAR
jgi:hypothetical protein